MMAPQTLRFRDLTENPEDSATNSLVFGFLLLLLLVCCSSMTIIYIRRRRMVHTTPVLPVYARQGHHRSPSIAAGPLYSSRDKVFVYDEKMNLINNSHGPLNGPVPEIRITFPEEEGEQAGQHSSGRVVVVRITDSGSVGMEPLQQEQLPPYQRGDDRFHSLEIDRLGGLREQQPQTHAPGSRWA